MAFREYKGLDLVAVAAEVLARWHKEGAFAKSLALREGAPEFVFFEGPPSANGMPGIHHVMARSVKDAVCRYKTQTGFLVRRRAGWDTHGLPVELGVEKKLGITKADIGTKISVADYNAVCRAEVMKYTRQWEDMTQRMGYWVDMQHPYVTCDNSYIETLWHLLRKIHGKGLLYKGHSIQPYSPTDGTGLSSHELNQPGCYKDVTDLTATVQFEVERDATSEPLFAGVEDGLPVCFLAWTTTPWTLPSNTALCVGPSIRYVRVRGVNPYSGQQAVYVLAEALVSAWFGEQAGGGKAQGTPLAGTFAGDDLVGIRYRQLIPWFRPSGGEAFRVVSDPYVTTSDGTGIVHVAPTFGADDKRVCDAKGMGAVMLLDAHGVAQPQVDRQGRFFRLEDMDPGYAATVGPGYAAFAGRYVKAGYRRYFEGVDEEESLDTSLCVQLKAEGKAFRIQKHTHSYPHSWRTDMPVIYYPLDAWFIRTSAVRETMVALNRDIVWKPAATGTGRFGQWLENVQDWNLSRSRFWGTPLPIWRTEDGKEEICIGSIAELSAEVDKAVSAGLMASNPLKVEGGMDLHRPYVDEIFLVSPSGRKMTREADVMDVWFDSGAMPYAQVGLQGMGGKDFGATADFIAEGVDQTRGWFYTLHAIHTMVDGTPAFRRVISNGLVLDKMGNKMSKRLGNAVDPFEVLGELGPDALRWYMLTNADPWDNLKFDRRGVEEVRRKFFGTLYNTYAFFALYANVDGFDPARDAVPDGTAVPEMDRWLSSLLNSLVREVCAAYEDYDIKAAGRRLETFVTDSLSNWYVRLNRKRFWNGEGLSPDKLSAYHTLHRALMTVSVLSAPIAPFYMDRLYADLGGAEGSVHFTRMPAWHPEEVDTALEERMALAQQVTSLVLGLRKAAALPVRQPLSRVVVPLDNAAFRAQLEAVRDIVLSEVNVKAMEFVENADAMVRRAIRPNFRTLGKRFGPRMKEIAAALSAMGQQDIAEVVRSGVCRLGDVTLEEGDYQIVTEEMPSWRVASEGCVTVALDVALTKELRMEGVARELVNRIQNLRKASGFSVTDRIDTVVHTDEALLADAVAVHGEYIKAQTLSRTLSLCPASTATEAASEVEWGDGTQSPLKLTIKR